jgi:hypothetical protein
MKKLYTLYLTLVCLLMVVSSNAQNDILLSQDFQEDIEANTNLFPDSPDSDSLYISWDEDGIDDANSRPGNWYWALAFESPDSIGAADSNFVFSSSSWLAGYDPGSTNWFITPAIYIGDDQATVHWKSAPFQGPRYMDGYKVKVLTGTSNHTDAESVTTIFEAAEMDAITGTGASVDLSNFSFTPGYIHADSYTDTTYFVPADTTAANPSHDGILEPHSASLADWAGQWVFIAFHHDSSDDNLIELDDIEVMGNLVSSTNDVGYDLRYVTYPNPVDNFLNVLFRTQEATELSLELFNQQGQRVAQLPVDGNTVGEFNEQFDLRQMPAGMYSVVLTVNGQRFTKNVVRR